MFEEKKSAKVTIQGWRSDSEIESMLSGIIDQAKIDHPKSFVKAQMMDHILKLGMFSYMGGNLNPANPDLLQEASSGSPMPQVNEPKPKAKRFNFKQALIDEGVNPDHATLWMDVRKAKKAVNSIEAFIQFKGNLGTYTLAQAVEVCANEQWKGFKVSWMENLNPEQKQRYSFMELAAGDHLKALPNQPTLAAPSYMDEFAALEHQHNGEG